MKHAVTTNGQEYADEPIVRLWTDGSSSNRDRTGGWAFIAQWGEVQAERFGYVEPATNISMELTAILRAVQFVRPAQGRRLVITTDSEYSIKALTQWMKTWRANGWRTSGGRPVANLELLLEAHEAIRTHRLAGTALSFAWVKGHAGHKMNEHADMLAGQARREQRTHWNPSTDAKF